MKIPSISDALARFAKSKTGQKIYNTLLNPKHETFMNNTLPLIESTVCTGSYIWATARDKKIPEEQKPILQWQNIINGVLGVAISGTMNRWVSKKGAEVIKGLKPELIPQFESVVNGVKVGLPILMTTLVMRFGISTASVPMSSAVKNVYNKLKGKSKDGGKEKVLDKLA